jgi:hypothetical protein
MQSLTLEMPLYAWALVGVLSLAWIYLLLPQRFRPFAPRSGSTQYLELKWRDPAPVAPPRKLTLEQLATTNSRQLLSLVRAFWEARACAVDVTGSELLIHRPSTGRVFAVARCNAAPAQVEVAEIEALWALVHRHTAPLGLYYGLGGFSAEALEFAKQKHLKLIAGDTLVSDIDALKPEQQRELHARLDPGMRAAA